MNNYYDKDKRAQSIPFPRYYQKREQKRILCYSFLDNSECQYQNNCIYAHTLKEQLLLPERDIMYKTVFENDLNGFPAVINELLTNDENNITIDEIKNRDFLFNPISDERYTQLILLTNTCDSCKERKCPGGLNCRNGAYDISFKICRNDLLLGECLNPETNLQIPKEYLEIAGVKNPPEQFIGCINGHHLTKRGLVPYYKFIKAKEKSIQNKIVRDTRYINFTHLSSIANEKLDYESSEEELSIDLNSDEEDVLVV